MAKRGLLIVFEGLDRVGKSSQVQLLQSSLEQTFNKTVYYQRFPDRSTASGLELNSLLTNQKDLNIKASHLLFSFNRWEKMEDMKNKLMKGHCVIVDRYAFSGVAYSIACKCDEKYALVPDQGLLRPDLVIQLDMPVDELKKRTGFGEERYEKEELQKKVQENYKLFHKKIYWRLINANQDKQKVHEDIVEVVKTLIALYDKEEKGDNENNSYPVDIKEDLFMSEDV